MSPLLRLSRTLRNVAPRSWRRSLALALVAALPACGNRSASATGEVECVRIDVADLALTEDPACTVATDPVAVRFLPDLSFTPGLMGISLGQEPDGAAPQMAAGYRAVGESVPSLVVAGVGGVGLWFATRAGVITKWSFFAALLVFVVAVVPLLPILFAPDTPEGPRPRRAATGIWLALGLLVAAFLPWADRISSNGWRILGIGVFTFLVLRVAIGVMGVVPESLKKVEHPSPDELGLDRPLSRADALDAGRSLGLDEELMPSVVGAGVGAGIGGAP